MIIIHDGDEIPEIKIPLGVGESDWFFVAWGDRLGAADLDSSEWVIEDDLFENLGEQFDANVETAGLKIFAKSNGVLLSLLEINYVECKRVKVSNKIIASGGDIKLTRSFYVRMGER